ncbi:MAG: 30S ribosomal protein S6, partial [Chloroflexi bacterium]|nr:30S ribosomal protein S6 [Chloroflexota bacterium]
MNEYELMYVISPRLMVEEIDSTIERIQGLVEDAGGEILLTDNWGRRRLAYP